MTSADKAAMKRWDDRRAELPRRGVVASVHGPHRPLDAARKGLRLSLRRPTVRPLAQRLSTLSLALCLAWTALPAAQAQVRLPALGESASDEFNLATEKRIGEQIMREIRRDPDYLDDAPLLAYVQQLWQPLVQAARARGDIGSDTERLFPYEAFLVRDRSVNAFALPGGYVGVHLGLIALTQSPDELASVLAHELSHITQRHIARSVSAQSRSSSLGLAAMLLGLIIASRASSVDAAQAAIAGGQAAMAQAQLNFSRDMEREADRNGFALMDSAGFAPAGMAAMFDRLDQSSRLNDSGGFPYLRSHPLTVDRIGEARQRVESADGRRSAVQPSLRHTLMQARARVLGDGSVQALRRLQGLDERAADASLPLDQRLAAYAGAALASSRLRDFPRALRDAQALARLLPQVPANEAAGRTELLHLLAELALARGDATAARELLTALPADASRQGLLLGAQLALADGSEAELRSSSDRMLLWLADHRQDAGVWHLLGQTATRQGQRLRAVRAEAEAQAALGNLPGAIDRLRAGQQLARGTLAGTDFIEASVIDARLRDLQGQRRALMDEARAARGNSRPGENDPDAEDRR